MSHFVIYRHQLNQNEKENFLFNLRVVNVIAAGISMHYFLHK
jgi:hypothetical protein